MNSTVSVEGLESVLADVETCVDALFEMNLDTCPDPDILTVWQRLETVSRRLTAVDHVVIGQVRDRSLDFAHGATSVPALARLVLKIGIRDAKARAAGAEAAGPRRGLSGEAHGPVFPHVAAAQVQGAISAEHARIIVRTIQQLPGKVRDEHGESAEQLLTREARTLDPDAMNHLAIRLRDTLDPDGRLPDDEQQQARRDLRLTKPCTGRPARLHGILTDELYEQFATILDVLAKPRPATVDPDDPDSGMGGVLAKDSRTPGQRNHDALLELVKLAQRAQVLPDSGGVTTTLILTVPAQDWAEGTGTVRTGHGLDIPTRHAWRWTSGQTRTMTAVVDSYGRITAYTDCRRTFTETQRLAMIARDKGCAFPGCDAPPQWTEAHHVIAHRDGGPTDIDNGCLLCSVHHRSFEQMGWRNVMINSIPHFIPPDYIDRHRKPRRNTTHDPAAHLNLS